jgi:hypothetical protein
LMGSHRECRGVETMCEAGSRENQRCGWRAAPVAVRLIVKECGERGPSALSPLSAQEANDE